MALTPTETVLVSITSSLATAFLIGIVTVVGGRWKRKREVKKVLKRFRLQLESAITGERASSVLERLIEFLQSNPELLEKRHIRYFSDTWLTDPLLELGKTHIALQADDEDRELRRLKIDAAQLTA